MYFSKYIKYKNKYTTLKKQFGGNDYNIYAIEISSPPDQPLQISQLCIYNSNGENIAHMFKIEASEPFIRNIDIGSADKAINGKCENSDFPDMYHSKNNGGTFKIIFSEPQTYVDIVYYNRNTLFKRMNGGKLMLYNDEKNLEFVMTEEKIQIFSNERIKNLLITEHDWNREEINKQKPREEEKIKRNLYEHKLKEDREKKAIEAKQILDEKRIEIPEGFNLIPTVYPIDDVKTIIINTYHGEQHICDIELHYNMILLKILVNNQDLIIDFINKFSKNFDIIYLDKDIKFNFEVILTIDKYRDYTIHEITNKYVALIANKEELNLFRQYDENEGINKIYIDEHSSRVHTDINYCINLMWVSVQPLFSNNFLIHPKYFDKIEMWINNNPNAKIIFWYDGDIKFTTFFSIINTRLFFEYLNRKYAGKIYLRDLSINPFVMKINELSPFLFGPVRLFNIDDNRLPLYFRVDLYRIIIAIYLLKYEEFTFFVYSDMDIEPYCNSDGNKIRCSESLLDKIELNKEYIFNHEVMSKLDEDGLVMQSMANIDSRLPSFENSFQIIGNKDPYKKSLIVAAFQIYILYENMEINPFGYVNHGWNFANTNLDKLKTDRNFDTMRNNFSSEIQSVYGSYPGALILFKNLIGKYTNLTESLKIKILESDLFRIHNKEELKLRDEVVRILRDQEEEIKIYNFGYFPPSIFIKIFSENNEGIYKKKYYIKEL